MTEHRPSISRRQFLTMAGATLGLLAACGQAGAPASSPAVSSAKPGTGSAAPASSAAASGAKPAASSASAAASPAGGTGSPIKIGLLLSFTGPLAATGEDEVNGFQLYLDSVGNQAGGRPISIVKQDDTTPDASLQRLQRMVEGDGVALAAGASSTTTAYAIQNYVNSAKIPFLIAPAAANDLTGAKKSTYIYRTSFNSKQASGPEGDWSAKNVAKHAYAIGSDYAGGHEGIQSFAEEYKAAGGQIIGEAYPAMGTVDFGPFLVKMKAANPEMVYAFFNGADALHFVQQYAQFGLKQIPLVGSGALTDDSIRPAEGAAAEGVKSEVLWAPELDNPQNKKFVSDYRAKYNKPPSGFSVMGYNTAHTAVDAINKTHGNVDDKEALLKAIAATKFDGPAGPFAIDPDTHNAIQNFYMVEVRKVDGALKNVVIYTFGMVKG